jgi:ribosomal protein S5
VIKATFDALLHLKNASKVAELRGKTNEEVAAASS